MYELTVFDRDRNVTYTTTDKEIVLERLASNLVYHFINHSGYIKSIKKVPNYNGTDTYKVYQDNGYLYRFTVKTL